MHTRISYLVTFFVFLMVTGTVAYGQAGSPYSRFGYGSIEHVGFGKNQAMGGVGIAIRSNSNVSPLNPASYSAIDTMSQIFELGVSGKGVQYKDVRESSTKSDMNFNYLAFAFPASKHWGMAIGVTPISFVGYDYGISAESPIDQIDYGYNGEGGISKVFFGNSFKLHERLSLGVNLNYMFGSMYHYRSIDFTDPEGNGAYSDYITFSSIEQLKVSAPQFSLGLQYVQPINEKSQLVFGGLYEPKVDLNAKRTIASYRNIPSGSQIPIEYIPEQKVDIEYPESYGVGLSYELNNKLQVAADYYMQQFHQAKYYGTDSLENRQRIALGAEYIPNYISPNYLKRVRYRIGGNISNNYQNLYGQEIVDFGITFGLGLPLGYSKTTFNVAMEYGKRGTTKNDLVREDYLKVVLNLSLNDIWFLKRKFK